ncbi:integrin alpha-PS1 [Anthonomus grandis grandis]|uniref:integrin alpha-PS1 n=1 Tax=Anthonomus grandis grandis TaxID=2921223 RepID=UPI0021658934|nr:integrin alpha-PS1 [Anthonomus grandis grandis]
MHLKRALALLCYVANFIRTTQSFNVEHRDPYVKKAPEGQTNSYFGYSVALHHSKETNNDISDNWILVGAPLGQNLQPSTNFSGAIFKCPITHEDEDCVQIPTDGHRAASGIYDFDYDEGANSASSDLLPPQNDEIKDGQWLGVSLRSQKPGGQVMVCAHRYIQSKDLTKYHLGQGLCYLMNSNLKITETLQPCKGLPTDHLHQEFGFCQVGTSATFLGENAVMGAPGPFTWRGTVFVQAINEDFFQRDKTTYKGPLLDTADPIDKYSYLGMSVDGGYIFDRRNYTFVAGAPRSQMMGQVYFFEKRTAITDGNKDVLNIVLIITGEQFASSFGYEILVEDVNNDGYDDLLVAAPFYYSDTKGGAVYVYYNLRNCKTGTSHNCTWDAVFYGAPQSRFGFALASIGDINKDGYNDVAIGAPYENNYGAVYVYLGSDEGLREKPSQVMSFPQLSTFGYSLSGGLDMDNNGYPDLLVGAYESERALLFLTRPIIDIKIDISSNDMHNINSSRKGCADDRTNKNNTCFSIRSCFSIVGKSNKFEKFAVIYHIAEIPKIIPRVWFKNARFADQRKNDNKLTVPVTNPAKQYCQREIVYIKEGVSDILSPIKFKVKYTLEDDSRPHTPILNTTSLKEFEATFQKDCGDDDVCVSNLQLRAGTNLEKSPTGEYTVNMVDQEFILEANISNLGESAYEAKLFIFHPTALSYINIKTEKNKHTNVKCSYKNDTLVVCDLGNPFQGNAADEIKLRFEIMKNTKDQKLELNLKVNSTSKEESSNTEAKVVAILQKIADFSIQGKGSTNLFFGGKVVGESGMRNLEDIGARVVHQYYLDNRGQWDLPDVKVNVQWPYQVRPGKEGQQGKWLLYLESMPKIVEYGVSHFGGDQRGPPVFCTVDDAENVINPLGLQTLTDSSETEEPANLKLPQGFQSENDTADTSQRRRRRRRRDVEYVVPAQEIRKEGIKRRVVIMNCQGSARCANINCYIRGQKKKSQITIEVRSRIWNSTLVEDYGNVDWVQINSYAEVEILDATFITKPDQVFGAETLVYPEAISPPRINWWIIAAAVTAGLLLLIVLVVILYKCGFFKRKRVKDGTLSGNLQKQTDESHTLLKN